MPHRPLEAAPCEPHDAATGPSISHNPAVAQPSFEEGSVPSTEPPHNPKRGLWSVWRNFPGAARRSSAKQGSAGRAWRRGRDEGCCTTVRKPLQANALNDESRSVSASVPCHNPRVGRFRTARELEGNEPPSKSRRGANRDPSRVRLPIGNRTLKCYEARDLRGDHWLATALCRETDRRGDLLRW